MPASERIRRHLQSNAIAYIALFVALSGTAIALPGKNKVKKNDIARGAVVGKAIAADAVKKAKIRDAAVIASKLGQGAVTTPALFDDAVTAPKLATDSVTRNTIVQGSINGGKIANGAIDSSKVEGGSLLAEDFAPGQISDAFLFEDVTGAQSVHDPAARARVRHRDGLGPLRDDALQRRVRGRDRRHHRSRDRPRDTDRDGCGAADPGRSRPAR